MVSDRGLLDDLFDVLASKVKGLRERVRMRLRGKQAPRRRKRRIASSKAAAALARKRWKAVKKAEAARQAKLAKRRLKRAADQSTNVIPFKRHVA